MPSTAAASATQACSSGIDRPLDSAVSDGTEDARGCSSIAISSSLKTNDTKCWFKKDYFHEE